MDDVEEKLLCLSDIEMVRLLEDNIGALLRAQPTRRINANNLLPIFSKMFGSPLQLDDYAVSCVNDLIAKIPSTAQVRFYYSLMCIAALKAARLT